MDSNNGFEYQYPPDVIQDADYATVNLLPKKLRDLFKIKYLYRPSLDNSKVRCL